MTNLRPSKAITALRGLKAESEARDLAIDTSAFEAWRSKVRGVLVGAFGEGDQAVVRFSGIRFWPASVSRNAPDSARIPARREGIVRARGEIDSAIYRLELLSGQDDLDQSFFDPELWSHVANYVADEDWSAVASQTAIFLEDKIRRWARDPKDKNGEILYGQALYGAVFADGSDLCLGSRSGERQGWRGLATGFAMALGNVDRHRIQNRNDSRRYAVGVLGVASLILTQLRFEHPERTGI